MSRRRSLVVVMHLFTVVMLGGTLPTPIYPFYAAQLGLTATGVTLVFAAYALGTMAALLLLGGASDALGRRRVLLAGVTIAAASSLTFLLADSMTLLLLGRGLSGLSVGVVTGAATAYLAELSDEPRRAVTLATVATMGGLGLGALLAGVVAEHTSRPTTLPYVVHLALLVPALLVVRAPETAGRPRDERGPAVRVQRLALPDGAGSAFGAASAAAFAAFALFGLFTALTSTFLSQGLHDTSHQAVGVLVALLFGAGVLGQLVRPRLGLRRSLLSGLVALPVGIGLLVASLAATSLPLYAVAALVGGAGVGLAFSAALALVAEVSPAERRAQVTSALFLLAYAGICVPVVAAGILVTQAGLLVAAQVLAALVAALAVVAIAFDAAHRRGLRRLEIAEAAREAAEAEARTAFAQLARADAVRPSSRP